MLRSLFTEEPNEDTGSSSSPRLSDGTQNSHTHTHCSKWKWKLKILQRIHNNRRSTTNQHGVIVLLLGWQQQECHFVCLPVWFPTALCCQPPPPTWWWWWWKSPRAPLRLCLILNYAVLSIMHSTSHTNIQNIQNIQNISLVRITFARCTYTFKRAFLTKSVIQFSHFVVDKMWTARGACIESLGARFAVDTAHIGQLPTQ